MKTTSTITRNFANPLFVDAVTGSVDFHLVPAGTRIR
jgi:hypothetical protein